MIKKICKWWFAILMFYITMVVVIPAYQYRESLYFDEIVIETRGHKSSCPNVFGKLGEFLECHNKIHDYVNNCASMNGCE